MSGKVKMKRCYLCNKETSHTRNFPPQSRPQQQMEWLLRQNRDQEGTTALLNRHKMVKEPRWCLRHFTNPTDELPTDQRLVRVHPLTLPTVPLRTTRPADLVPSAQFNTQPSLVDSLREDSVAGSRSVQDTLSPTVTHSNRNLASWTASQSAPLSLEHEDDVTWNDVDEILPKRFKSAVSTNTITTIESKGSEYRCSQETLGEEVEEEIEEDEEANVPETGRYALVEKACLMRLFKWCEECGARLDQSQVTMRKYGSARIATYDFLRCNRTVTWESQEKVGEERGKVYSANHGIPIAAFITGTPIPRLIDFAKLLDIDLPCDRTMRKNIREIGSVAIENVYAEWQATVREVAVNAAEGKGLEVSHDGQFCTPGHNATNCKCTVMDCRTRLALAGVAMHKKMDGIEGVSCRMESEGVLRELVDLIDDGIEISTRVGDQNGMVNKKLRENPKTESIEVKLDWWHTQKPMRKAWWKMVKANPDLAPFYQLFFNHLYFVHNKYPNKNDRPRALEVVQSFVMHIQGIHKWKKSDEFQLVTKCEHGRLKKKKNGEERPTLQAGSEDLELIRTMVFAPKFEKAFLSSDSLIDTAINECYHSLSLMYSAKRFACSPFYYHLKMLLSMMHYNSLMLDDLLGRRHEIGNTMLSRRGRLIMEESIKVRVELNRMRVAKRIGIPEDDVFDELKSWWEEKENIALESGYDVEGEEEIDYGEASEEEEYSEVY